jgi:hypothetical protein
MKTNEKSDHFFLEDGQELQFSFFLYFFFLGGERTKTVHVIETLLYIVLFCQILQN